MKANELMIGDWVVTKKGDGQVYIIQDNDVIFTSAIEGIEGAAYLEETDPINITDGFLIRNGFTEQPDVPEGCVNWVYNNGGQIVYISRLPWDSFSIDANFHGRLSTQIKYVHELQHILRLIGLNDLADNFKIV